MSMKIRKSGKKKNLGHLQIMDIEVLTGSKIQYWNVVLDAKLCEY